MTYPKIQVDGIDLDDTNVSPRWLLSDSQPLRMVPARRLTTVVVPGRSGALRPFYEPFSTSAFSIMMNVYGYGTTVDARRASLEGNIDSLVYLMNRDVINIQYTRTADNTRVASARLSSATEPQKSSDGTQATITFTFDIPSGVWTDATFTTGSYLPGTAVEVSELNGLTAPVSDSKILFKGPFTKIDFLDFESRQTMRIRGVTASSGQWLLVDCEQMRATLEGGASWEHIGADKTANVDSIGPGSATSWLNFYPRMISAPDVRRAYYDCLMWNGSTVLTTNTVQIRTRRAFAS